ncbi:MAG: sel1 repeat family protein [bacterium]|nr:sel1 repeat family protein [bacterium]
MRRSSIACLLLAALVVPAAADDFQAALEAYESGDYATARSLWLPLADDGVAEAQFNIGLLYQNGRGVDVDVAGAAEYFRLAAEQAYPRALFKLGEMYEDGQGVEQSDIQAHFWFNVAHDLDVEGAKKRRKRLAKRMTPYDIAQAELFAREWHKKRKAAKRA